MPHDAGHNEAMNRQMEVGELVSKWSKEYGNVWRLKGCMGVSIRAAPSLRAPPCAWMSAC